MKILFGLSAILVFLAALVSPARADGPLQSDMYTLDEIYYYLTEGAEPSEERPGLDPTSGAPGEDIPGFTKSLADIYEDIRILFEGCDVTPGQVLESVTFFSTDTDNWGPRTGTIATRTLSAASETVAAGYYAATTLSAVDPDLASGNIKSGVNIFGKAGTLVPGGTAAAVDVLSGKTFYSGDSWTQKSGSIPSKGAQTYTPGTSNQTITAGQYLSGTQTISGDADLVATNIKSGVNIFGVTGATTVQYIGDANAAAGDVKSGKTFYSVSGTKKTGTMDPALVYGAHTHSQCIAAGGTVYDTGGGMTICRFTLSACPEGWVQAGNWQRYASGLIGGDACGSHKAACPSAATQWGANDCSLPGDPGGSSYSGGCSENPHCWHHSTTSYRGNTPTTHLNPTTGRLEIGCL